MSDRNAQNPLARISNIRHIAPFCPESRTDTAHCLLTLRLISRDWNDYVTNYAMSLWHESVPPPVLRRMLVSCVSEGKMLWWVDLIIRRAKAFPVDGFVMENGSKVVTGRQTLRWPTVQFGRSPPSWPLPPSDNDTLLVLAVRHGQLDAARLLIDMGAEANFYQALQKMATTASPPITLPAGKDIIEGHHVPVPPFTPNTVREEALSSLRRLICCYRERTMYARETNEDEAREIPRQFGKMRPSEYLHGKKRVKRNPNEAPIVLRGQWRLNDCPPVSSAFSRWQIAAADATALVWSNYRARGGAWGVPDQVLQSWVDRCVQMYEREHGLKPAAVSAEEAISPHDRPLAPMPEIFNNSSSDSGTIKRCFEPPATATTAGDSLFPPCKRSMLIEALRSSNNGDNNNSAEAMLRLLLEEGKCRDTATNMRHWRHSALMYCIDSRFDSALSAKNRLACVELLCKNPPPGMTEQQYINQCVNRQEKNTPLMVAVQQAASDDDAAGVEMVKLLLRLGADPEIQDVRNQTVVFQEVARHVDGAEKPSETLKVLLEHQQLKRNNSNNNNTATNLLLIPARSGMTAFEVACRNGASPALLQFLADQLSSDELLRCIGNDAAGARLLCLAIEGLWYGRACHVGANSDATLVGVADMLPRYAATIDWLLQRGAMPDVACETADGMTAVEMAQSLADKKLCLAYQHDRSIKEDPFVKKEIVLLLEKYERADKKRQREEKAAAAAE